MQDYLLKISTKEGSLLKTIVELFQASFSQMIINLTKEGISCRMTNVRENMLFDLKLEAENFNEFYLKEDLFFGINVSHLHKILSSVKKRDTITLEIREGAPNKLFITVVPKEYDYKDVGFIILEKVQNINIGVPEGYEGFIHAPYSKFSKMWKELLGISKQVKIKGNSKRIEFQSIIDGILCKWTEYCLSDAPANDTVDEIYQIDDLMKLNKIAGFSSPISFYVKEGLPIKMRVNIGSLGSLCVYICSPKEM